MLKIGFSSCFFHADPVRPIFKGKTLVYLEQSIAHWCMREQALAFMIPPVGSDSAIRLEDLVREMDGLILQGGSDVSPRSYGEEPLKPEWGGDAIRDAYEVALTRTFISQKKPVLGVCRGAQLLNIAFGGTLYQDIGTQISGAKNHRNWEIYDQNFHATEVISGSGLAKLYPGVSKVTTNSIHHQAVKNLGKGFKVEAVSEGDGIIEAIRLEGLDYVFAVQWHPEFQDETDSKLLNCRPILREFLNVARSSKK